MTERERFEAYAPNWNLSLARDRDLPETYVSSYTQLAWQAWQAATAQATAPREPTPTAEIINAGGYFNWSWQGVGFGQLSFSIEDGAPLFHTECMGRVSVRKLLHAFADAVADQHDQIAAQEKK